jgi:chromosome partitioning protein
MQHATLPFAIGCISQKGGAWKSTISRALGTTYVAAGWAVKIIDLDIKQATCTNWQQRRLAAGIEPTVPVQQYGNVAAALSRAGDADLFIFDGPANATEETVKIAKACNLLILPTGLTLDDLQPQVALANSLVDKHGIPVERIVFALCKASKRAAPVEAARVYLGKTRFAILDGAIEQADSYAAAMNEGKSITETPFKGPKDKAAKVIQSAVNHFERLTA